MTAKYLSKEDVKNLCNYSRASTQLPEGSCAINMSQLASNFDNMLYILVFQSAIDTFKIVICGNVLSDGTQNYINITDTQPKYSKEKGIYVRTGSRYQIL